MSRHEISREKGDVPLIPLGRFALDKDNIPFKPNIESEPMAPERFETPEPPLSEHEILKGNPGEVTYIDEFKIYFNGFGNPDEREMEGASASTIISRLFQDSRPVVELDLYLKLILVLCVVGMVTGDE